MHFIQDEKVILPVITFEKKKKNIAKSLDHNDVVEDMDDFFRMAHEAAMLETMPQGLVRGDQTFYIQGGRGKWTMKFKGVPIDNQHGKCDGEVGAWCAKHGMHKWFNVDFSKCSRLISKQLSD